MFTTAVVPSANESIAAAPATTATRAPKRRTAPKPGDVVRVRKIFGAGKGVELYATVLTVAPSLPELVGEDGMPTITVAFVKSGVAIGILGSGNWHQAFDRVANVAPASHKEVRAGARGIFWVDVLPAAGDSIAADSFAAADLPEIEGRASTVFSREKAEDFFEKPAKTVPLAVEPVHETKHYSDGSSATGPAPLPDQSPAQQAAAQQAAAHSTPSAADLDAAAAEAKAKADTTAAPQPETASATPETHAEHTPAEATSPTLEENVHSESESK